MIIMPYYPVQKHQTELDMAEVVSLDTPAKLRNTDVTVSQRKNKSFTERGIQLMSLPKISIKNPDACRERIEWFFNDCVEKSIKPSVSALAMALGISRSQLYSIVQKTQGVERNYPPESIELVQHAYQMLDVLWEDYMLNGQVNPASGIFLGKNHFGYRDVQDYVISPGDSSVPTISQEELEAKYKEIPEMEE